MPQDEDRPETRETPPPDPHPLAPLPPDEPAVAPVVVPRWLQLVLVPLGVLAVIRRRRRERANGA
jgi:hypothetical protein